MGRPRNDAEIQRAKGTDKRSGHVNDRTDAAAPHGEPTRPSNLTRREGQIWDEHIFVLRQMKGVLTIADGQALADLCRVISQKEDIEAGMHVEAKEAEATIREENKLAEKGVKKKSTRVARAKILATYQPILERLRMRQLALENEFGGSPRSRSQIKVQAPGFVPTGSQASGPQLVTDPSLYGGSAGLQKM